MADDPIPANAELSATDLLKFEYGPSQFAPGAKARTARLLCPSCSVTHPYPGMGRSVRCACGIIMQNAMAGVFVWREADWASIRIIEIIAEQYGVAREAITPETGFFAELAGDDLDRLAVTLDIETEFGIAFDDADIEKFQSVGDVIDLTNQLLAAREASWPQAAVG